MAKQAVGCKNMVRVKVWHTHTTVWLLNNYSQRTLTYFNVYAYFIIGRKIRIIRVLYYWT